MVASRRQEASTVLNYSELDTVIVTPCVSSTLAFAVVDSKKVFSKNLNIFPTECMGFFCIMQSQLHGAWARAFSSSMKDDLNYSPTDCFETFPFPSAIALPMNLFVKTRICSDLLGGRDSHTSKVEKE